MKLLKLFKKNKEEKIIRYSYPATIVFNDGTSVEIIGSYPKSSDLASTIVELLEYRNFFYSQKSNGDRIIIKTKDVKSVVVGDKPLEDDIYENKI